LLYLHEEKGIVHQDIKLENLFTNNLSAQIKLGDFGFAQFIKDFGKTDIANTEGYSAPELKQGIRGAHNDIYSLAVTFIKLLTGDNGDSEIALKKVKNL
jgi:serine/threonine protein kinase